MSDDESGGLEDLGGLDRGSLLKRIAWVGRPCPYRRSPASGGLRVADADALAAAVWPSP